MKQFFIKISLFILIQFIPVGILLSYLQYCDSKLHYSQGKTESALLCIPSSAHVDLLFMGSSHARMFSRNSNHNMVEKTLKKNIVNIGISAAGLIPEELFLKYFYAKKNSVPIIVYFIDPFVFSTRKWNQDLYFLTGEPFRFDFLFQLLFTDINLDVKYNYIKSKFSKDWRNKNASVLPNTTDSLKETDTSNVRQRIASIFPDGHKKGTFLEYKKTLIHILEMAKKNNARVIFIIPPSLLGKFPLTDELMGMKQELKERFNSDLYNYSETIESPQYYYNHDHLNNAGVEMFTKKYLLPLIQ